MVHTSDNYRVTITKKLPAITYKPATNMMHVELSQVRLRCVYCERLDEFQN
jgi:aspartate carbamoyltransferase regulatory subunit